MTYSNHTPMNTTHYSKILTLLTVWLATATAAFAQAGSASKEKMYSIKKDAAYMYVDVTSETQQLASSRAESALYQDINRMAKRMQARPVTGQALKSKVNIITMPRGDKYRAFAYIRKADAVSGASAPAGAPSAQPVVSQHREVVTSRLLALKSGGEIRGCVSKLKEEGHLESFNVYRNIGNPTQYVLIVYDQQGGIQAILSEGPQRKNMRTGAADDIANYRGMGAIGVKIRK